MILEELGGSCFIDELMRVVIVHFREDKPLLILFIADGFGRFTMGSDLMVNLFSSCK